MRQMALTFIPPVIAHRGASAHAPENTLPAFVRAREDGAMWIETDVKLTSDGMPILMHDDTFDRTTSGQGSVADRDWAEARQFDAGKGFGPEFAGTHIPSLMQAARFALEAGVRLNLELKPCPGRAQATAMVTLIEAAKFWDDHAPPPLISSFDIELLVIAARLHPEWPRGLLMDSWREDWPELAKLTQAATLNIKAEILTPERITALTASGLPLLAYTVNEPEHAKKLLHQGVAAVYTDDPAALLRAL